MDLTPVPKPPAVVVDASFIIGFCAFEPDKYSTARAKLNEYATSGWELFSPNVAVAEVLYALCRKFKENVLDAADYAKAVQQFIALLSVIKLPPKGDASLVVRAEQIRSAGINYGCSRANDSFYLALAEQLKEERTTELVTFDDGIRAQGRANASSVTVEFLPAAKP